MSARAGALVRSPVAVIAFLAAALLVVNVVLTPGLFGGRQLANTATLLVPTALAAMASVPSILSGRGGIDLSIGPLLGFVNVVLVGVLLSHGLGSVWVALPLCLLIGTAAGAANGAAVAFIRLQPVVVTLGSYLVLAGAAFVIMPQPTGSTPDWAHYLSGAWLHGYFPRSLLLVLAAAALWALLAKLGVVGLILSAGSEDRAAYTSGVRLGLVRVAAYAIGGCIAALAGIALNVLIASGDPGVGRQYTLAAIAAVALGGNPLRGGRGTMVGPVLGAACLFLIQTMLSAAHVSSLWIQVVYGLVLLGAVSLNASLSSRLAGRSVPMVAS
jgi:ribose transport system permease protein